MADKKETNPKKTEADKKKQDALAKLDSVIAVIEKYDEISTIANMIDGKGGSIDFITLLLKVLGVTKEEILSEISLWLCGTTDKITDAKTSNGTNISGSLLDSIELAIKAILYSTMMGMFTCSATPLIPNYMFQDVIKHADGVEIPLNILDIYGLLSKNPVSVEGQNFYFDTIRVKKHSKTIQDIRGYQKTSDGTKPYENIKEDSALIRHFPDIIDKKFRDSIWYTYKDKKKNTQKTFSLSNIHDCDYNSLKMYYYDISGYDQTTVWKSRDFNAYLWYVINKKDAQWDNRNNLYEKTLWNDKEYEKKKDIFFDLQYNDENKKLYLSLDRIKDINQENPPTTPEDTEVVGFRKKIILDGIYLERVYNTTESNMLKIYLNKEEYFQKRQIKNLPTQLKINIKKDKIDDKVKDTTNYEYHYLKTKEDSSFENEGWKWEGPGTYKFTKQKNPKNGTDFSIPPEFLSAEDLTQKTKGKLEITAPERADIKLNKTIFEFNYDFIFSLKFFDPQTLVTNIIDRVLNWGLTNATASYETHDRVIAGIVGKMTDEIIRREELEIDDNYYSFSNQEYDELLTKTRKDYNGAYKISDDNGKLTELDRDEILKSINDISEASTLQEQKTIIEKLLRDVTVSSSQQERMVTDNTFNVGFGSDWECIPRLLHEVCTSVVLQALSPKVMVLYAINCKIFNDTDANVKKVDPIEYMERNLNNLLSSLVVQINNLIVSLLLSYLMAILQPKIKKFVEKLNLEQAMLYARQLKMAFSQCLSAYKNWADYLGDLIGTGKASNRSIIDNVTYADIIPTQTTPKE